MAAQCKFDPDIAAPFIANYREAIRAAQSLATSVRRAAGLFPLDGHALEVLDDDAMEKLDAFRVRFSGLQDLLSNKLFRGILFLEEEAPQSMRDILNTMDSDNNLLSLSPPRRKRAWFSGLYANASAPPGINFAPQNG